MANLDDILKDDDELRDDDLLKYLQGGLSKDKHQEIEQQIQGSEFASDAMEGLKGIYDKKNIQQYVDDLNLQLQKQLSNKKRRKERRKLKDHPWIIIAIAIVLAICILVYAMIRYYQKQQVQEPAGIEQKL